MSNRSVRGPYSGSTSFRAFESICCWPDCEADLGDSDAPLCRRHLGKAYRVYQDVYLSALEVTLNAPLNRALVKQGMAPRLPQEMIEGRVYFVRLGSLVKIGWTGDMEQRMKAVPHEEILGTIPGTMADEKRCHKAFDHLCVKGEWFRAEPDLLAFVADVTKVEPQAA